MLKEKFSKFFKDDGNNQKKTENLVFLLVILIVTVIAINVIWKDEDAPKNTTNNSLKQLAVNENKSTVELVLEEKLENILSKIVGVGNVDVLLTYNETEQIIPIYNTKDKTSVINETDSTGRNKGYTRK